MTCLYIMKGSPSSPEVIQPIIKAIQYVTITSRYSYHGYRNPPSKKRYANPFRIISGLQDQVKRRDAPISRPGDEIYSVNRYKQLISELVVWKSNTQAEERARRVR